MYIVEKAAWNVSIGSIDGLLDIVHVPERKRRIA